MCKSVCKSDCIFYDIYRDHGASVPLCSRGHLDLTSAISFFKKLKDFINRT